MWRISIKEKCVNQQVGQIVCCNAGSAAEEGDPNKPYITSNYIERFNYKATTSFGWIMPRTKLVVIPIRSYDMYSPVFVKNLLSSKYLGDFFTFHSLVFFISSINLFSASFRKNPQVSERIGA